MSRVDFAVKNCDGNEYVLFPACAYNGNRFNVLKRDYPPMFKPEEAKVDMEVTITDVPRLNKDGSGKIQVTTGDVATPCVGVFSKSGKTATFVYTVQEINGENIGLAYEKGMISLTYPAYREECYRWPHMKKNEVPYQDIEAEIPYKIIEEKCESIQEFYALFQV